MFFRIIYIKINTYIYIELCFSYKGISDFRFNYSGFLFVIYFFF